ncbi:DnaD domain-containing protein [Bacillus sp. A301a_S52]|nr:DnaD domain-containing protein [Bacillus sp. A301a_S52]
MENQHVFKLLSEPPFTLPGLFFKYYKNLGLTDEQFLILIHIRQFHQEGNDFPTPDNLVERMTITSNDCAHQLKELLSKRFIEIVESKGTDNKISEMISIAPLFEKLQMHLNEQSQHEVKEDKQLQEGKLFQRFEEEFARPLSPMEMEMISMWLDDDGHEPFIIEAALRESVASSKLNFRYIDRILFDWKKNGVKTIEQAKSHGENIRNHQSNRQFSRSSETKREKKHPGYNWLEGGSN